MLQFEAVRQDLAAAQVVLPSFDAPDAATFQHINRPCPEISFEQMAGGLVQFRNGFAGAVWVEIFLVDGVNTGDAAVEGFARWMERIRPDKIHLNTAVRPTAEADVRRPPDVRLMQIRDRLGPHAEIVVPYQGDVAGRTGREGLREELLDLLSRRPCTRIRMKS
jgi:wyosine [tRNA(Phe)-imidazoG37] synthetase (radical SAM superfamily)